MTPNATKKYEPEDKDQAIVDTPYGQGLVIRSRRSRRGAGPVKMREIQLLDWVKPKPSRGPQKPSMLYSPTSFPSVKPKVNDDVTTNFGRGKITEMRKDGILVVRISSWRLAGRSVVTCYLTADAVQVVRAKKTYEMTAFEKVEHAQELKNMAALKFASKDYNEALQLYAMAVDAVRYVQHTQNTPNELRADLLEVMITCCNNAATCCLQLHEWERTQKFGKNALVLLEALEEKKGNSQIHKLLNQGGKQDSQLFGTWKVKSHLLIARGKAEQHESDEALETLKKAIDIISKYKKEGDPMFKSLHSQEKEARKLFTAVKARQKAEKKKEKMRARAMFGGGEEKKVTEKQENSDSPKEIEQTEPNKADVSPIQQKVAVPPVQQTRIGDVDSSTKRKAAPRKNVSFADGSKPGDEEVEPSFFENHFEAILIISGIAIGGVLTKMLWRKSGR